MEAKWIVVVVVLALLAGLVGGIFGISLISGGTMMRMGPMMTPMMMNPQMMVEMQRQVMADPTVRTQMLEMHRQMHDEMERR